MFTTKVCGVLPQAMSGGALSLEQVESVVMIGSVMDNNTAAFGGAAVVIGSTDKLSSFQVSNTSITRHQVRPRQALCTQPC
jgi:hypothetical protein